MGKNKNKGKKVNQHEINMNVDTEQVLQDLLYFPLDEPDRDEYQEELQIWAQTPAADRGTKPKLVREEMTGAEFFKDIVMKALSMTKKTGNTASLRRTKSIADLMDHAIESEKGILKVFEEDYKYIKSAMGKADGWTNNEDIASSVILVEDCINKAEGQNESPDTEKEDKGEDD